MFMHLSYDIVLQTVETRRRSVHQRIQQTARAALSTEVPGVSDREASQVGVLPAVKNHLKETKGHVLLFAF